MPPKDRAPAGDNTFEDRDKVRRYLANRVRQEIPQCWDDSKAELFELIGMLGLFKADDPKPGPITLRQRHIVNCGPVSQR